MQSSPERRTPPPNAVNIAAENGAIAWSALEAITHVDPAGRGLSSFRRASAPLDAGQLRAAALHLAKHACSVGIVTGFCVATGDGITVETDGPPGALFLARALLALGVDVSLIGDHYALPLLSGGCEMWNLDRAVLVEIPFEDGPPGAPARQRNDRDNCMKTDRWVADFLATGRGRSLTHLISIERPGPSHTSASIASQPGSTAAIAGRFSSLVPADCRNACHNMRGESINAFTAKAHRLFEAIAERDLPITSIGIGDGGNEIGMGHFAWESLVAAVDTPQAPWIVSRTSTDYTILSGVSNWAAYALALAVGRLCDAVALGVDWDARRQQELIERMVYQTAAVDGLTRRREPTVDGLPMDVYLRPLEEMRTLLGY
jgi:hypothetical protein